MAPAPPPPAPTPSRPLSGDELDALLALDVPAHLGTLDRAGFPRITPIWFLWEEGTFHMTSVPGKRQLADLKRDPRASLCIDTESPLAIGGQRPNRQARARGRVETSVDVDGRWTRRITFKYIPGPEGEAQAAFRASMPRVLIRLRPERLIAMGTSWLLTERGGNDG